MVKTRAQKGINIDARIKKRLASALEIKKSEIKDDSTMDTIQSWDSLNHLKLIMELEEEFGISFDSQEIMSLNSFSNIRNAVKSHLD